MDGLWNARLTAASIQAKLYLKLKKLKLPAG